MITYALFYLCQHILELGIVDLNTVVQVDLDHLIGQVMQLFLVGNGLGQLILELFDALGQRDLLTALGRSQRVLGVGDLRAIALLLLVHIVGANTRQQAGV